MRLGEPHRDGYASSFILLGDGMSGAIGPVEAQGQGSAGVQEVTPPRLRLGHADADNDVVPGTSVGHRDAEGAPGASTRIGQHGDVAVEQSAEAAGVGQRGYRRIEDGRGSHQEAAKLFGTHVESIAANVMPAAGTSG